MNPKREQVNRMLREVGNVIIDQCEAALAASGCSPSPSQRVCTYCGQAVTDWVDPDWARGRICRPCETKYAPAEEKENAPGERRLPECDERKENQ